VIGAGAIECKLIVYYNIGNTVISNRPRPIEATIRSRRQVQVSSDVLDRSVEFGSGIKRLHGG